MRSLMSELKQEYLTFQDYKESEFAGVYDEFSF